MKQMFLETVQRAKVKFDFRIENFCIMNNHVHLIVVPGRHSNLSKIMQWILSVFAMRFNRVYGLKGHVWYDRFRSKVIDDIRQFLTTFLYIARNPVRAFLVDDPFDYPYSGIRHIVEGRFNVLDPPIDMLALLFPSFIQRSLPGNASDRLSFTLD